LKKLERRVKREEKEIPDSAGKLPHNVKNKQKREK